jgi:hypothetical protein
MTADAQPRIAARLLGMPSHETGPVEVIARRPVECEPCRDRSSGRTGVATGAGAFGVTRAAQLKIRSGARAVAPGEIRVVDEVIFWLRSLFLQVDMARIAAPGAPLIAVGVAAHAGGHRRPQRVRFFLNVEVAPYAVAVRAREVSLVIEPQVFARERRALACGSLSVAGAAFSIVMRFFVAAPASRRAWDGDGIGITGALDRVVTAHALNSLEHMGAMLEAPPLPRA